MKQCSKCKETKSLLEFYRNNRNMKSKYLSSCKKCQNQSNIQCALNRKVKFGGLYEIWRSMNQRCYNPKAMGFEYWGKRGITVCQEWQDSFLNFYKWAKNKRKTGLQIDRENNDGNYTPENCRFVTPCVNSRNRQNTKLDVEKVKVIKQLLKEAKLSQPEISKMFNVVPSNISAINTGITWTDIN